jgi:hypothetical protein
LVSTTRLPWISYQSVHTKPSWCLIAEIFTNVTSVYANITVGYRTESKLLSDQSWILAIKSWRQWRIFAGIAKLQPNVSFIFSNESELQSNIA